MKTLVTTITFISMIFAGTAFAAGGGGNSNDSPANTIHPNINQNNGPGQNANPNGVNDGGGNMHGIGNNPGKSGSKPNDDGVKGQANELETMHGGIGNYNKNAN